MTMKLVQSQTLLFVALFLFLALVESRDVSLWAFGPNRTDITYEGDARVDSGILYLAGTEPSGAPKKESVGRVVYSKPIRFWTKSPPRQVTLSTTIKFLIKPSRNGAAEGIAFFIAPANTTIQSGSVGGNLGIYNGGVTRNVFAVEFDTNYNAWDPKYHHLGINIQSRASSNVTRFNAGTGEEVTARINYFPNNKTITVVATSASQTAELSLVSDLKDILTQDVRFGITASTGWYISGVGIPNILSWTYTSSLVPTGLNNNEDAAYIQQVVV